MSSSLTANLLSPILLAFALGFVARLVRSDLRLPKDLYGSLTIYLLLALGLKGGHELAHASFAVIAAPIAVSLALGCLTPISAYLVLRRLGGFAVADAAAIAAHYGSVSAATFLAAQSFVTEVGTPAEGYLPSLLALLEGPGLIIGLALGVAQTGARGRLLTTAHEIVTGRTVVLLLGGLAIGYLMDPSGWVGIAPFFESGFKGALVLFLLEMGGVAADRASDLRKVGPFLLVFGTVVPVVHGIVGVAAGTWAGMSVGGATVLGAMVGSASYIAAPPAARLSLPEANPTLSLTASLAITFPFNLAVGIPLFHAVATHLGGSP